MSKNPALAAKIYADSMMVEGNALRDFLLKELGDNKLCRTHSRQREAGCANRTGSRMSAAVRATGCARKYAGQGCPTALVPDEFIVVLLLFNLSESQIDYQQKRRVQGENNGNARLWPYVVMGQSGCCARYIQA